MALTDDRVAINTQDAGDENAWSVNGHVGAGLNDSTSQIPIFREGSACADGQIQISTGTFTENTEIDISQGIRAFKLYVIWLWMTSNAGYDGTTHIRVGIADGPNWTGNGGLWDMKALFQETDRGGWQPCVVYPSNGTPTPASTIGTFANLIENSISSQRIDISNASGVQIRQFGIEASFVISYVGGHSATITLDDLTNHSKDKTANRDFGIFNKKGLSYRSQVVIRLGDALATGLTTFSEQSKIIHFDTVNSDHEIGFDFINDTGGDELEFQLGDFVGGAPVGGVFAFWNVFSPLNTSSVFIGSVNCDRFRLYAGTFLNAGPTPLPPHVTSKGSVADLATIGAGGTGYVINDLITATSGTGTKATFNVDTVAAGVVTAITQLSEGNYTVDPTNPSATTSVPAAGRSGLTINITTRFYKESKGYTWDTSGEVDVGDLTFESNNILNAVSGVLYSGAGIRRAKNNKYIGCTDALHFDTAQTITITGDQFSGNTNDIHFSGAGALIINASGSNVSTSRVSGGGTVTINNDTSVTFTGMKDNSEVRIYDAGTGVEIAGIEDATAGTIDNRSFTWQNVAANTVDYVIHNWQPGVLTYQTIRVNGFTVPSADVSIGIQQQVDRNVV